MAFPNVETVAESSTNTAGTSHVVTLPSGIQAGDLLLVMFDKGSTSASVNALAGWAELLDEALANGIYLAYRWADGTEGASITLVTTASTRSANLAYRISGAMNPATQVPELSTVATGTSTGPNATTCTPTGGAKDYLWISFFGQAGEEADDDTWCNTAPTSFSNLLQKSCGTAGTNLGGLIASAEYKLNAASLDAAAFNVDVSAAWRAYTIAVHPGLPPTQTAVDEVGLTPVGTPATATGLKIVARALTASAATNTVLCADLYQGSTRITGATLATTALTTSVVEYTLTVLDVDAANITDWGDLRIRFYGYSASADTSTVRVTQLWLVTPESTTSPAVIVPSTAGAQTTATAAVTAPIKIAPAASSAQLARPRPPQHRNRRRDGTSHYRNANHASARQCASAATQP